jgi:hypothetical protein
MDDLREHDVTDGDTLDLTECEPDEAFRLLLAVDISGYVLTGPRGVWHGFNDPEPCVEWHVSNPADFK